MIRKMESRDIEQIQEIDEMCFKTNSKRTREGIRGYIEASNNSSIVYELNNKVIGFNFLHIWGSFAWFGAFGVHPKYQGEGIGKELIKYTIKILKEEYKVSTIGLNTMPESSYNVGFYMSFGFIPLKLTLNLKKQLNSFELLEASYLNRYNINEVELNNEENYLNLNQILKEMSNKIDTNLDFSSELGLLRNGKFGGVFTLGRAEEIHGIVLYYTKSIREDSSKDLQIKLAIIDNDADYREIIDAVIEFCTKRAQKIKYESISIDCNTYNLEICNYLIVKHKFKIQKNMVMMLMGEDNIFESKNVVLLTRLAG